MSLLRFFSFARARGLLTDPCGYPKNTRASLKSLTKRAYIVQVAARDWIPSDTTPRHVMIAAQ